MATQADDRAYDTVPQRLRDPRRVAVRRLTMLGVAFGAAIVWWVWRVEAPMRVPRVTAETFDAYAYYYPMFRYAFDTLRGGELPLWNPYQHCGTPFFATGQHLLLYPLNALFLALPTATALKSTNILHIALAVLFTYILAHSFGLSRVARPTAGLIFAFNPVVLNNIYAPHHLYGSVWIPLHLALVRIILTRQRKRLPAMLLGAAVAAQYLGGYPMHCIFSVYLMGLYVLWYTASHAREMSWRCVVANGAALVGAGVLASLLALPQLLAAIELAPLSPRPLGGMTLSMVDPGYVPGGTLPLETLAGMLLPTRDSVFASGFTPHVGMLGLALAAVGVAFALPRRNVLFFAVVALGFGALGLGRYTSLYDLYFLLPTSDWFRGPNRFFVLAAVGLAMLAGYGVDAFARNRVGRRGLVVLLAAAAVLAISTSLVLVAVPSDSLAAFATRLQGAAALPGESSFAARLGWLCAYAWAACAWLAAYRVRRQWRRPLIAALPVAAYVGLMLSFINYAPLPDTHPEVHTMPPSIVEFLRDHQEFQRAYIVPWGAMLPSRFLRKPGSGKPEPPQPLAEKSGMMHGLYVVDDRENVYPVRFSDYVSRMTPPEDLAKREQVLASLGLTSAEGVPQGSFFVRADAPNLRLLDLLGTRFVVEGPQTTFAQPAAPERFPLVHASDGVNVYRNQAALPRAFVVGRAEVITEPARVLDRLTSPDFDPLRSVILEKAPAQAQPPGNDDPRADVRFVTYGIDEVTLQVRTSSPGFLVLTDQYYPGWNATVDGEPAAIHLADYLFRAVQLDAGEHRVVFRYAPSWWRWGMLGSLGGVILLACLLIAELRARSARRGTLP